LSLSSFLSSFFKSKSPMFASFRVIIPLAITQRASEIWGLTKPSLSPAGN